MGWWEPVLKEAWEHLLKETGVVVKEDVGGCTTALPDYNGHSFLQ